MRNIVTQVSIEEVVIFIDVMLEQSVFCYLVLVEGLLHLPERDSLRRAVVYQLAFDPVEDTDKDFLTTENRQLHGFLDQALISLTISDISLILVSNH
jgi:hypothetical protein